MAQRKRTGKKQTLTKRELETIIKNQLPNYRLVQRMADPVEVDDQTAEADAVSPSLEELRRKYLGDAYAAPTGIPEGSAEDDHEDEEVIVVEPRAARDRDHGAGPKVAFVKGKKIIGMED